MNKNKKISKKYCDAENKYERIKKIKWNYEGKTKSHLQKELSTYKDDGANDDDDDDDERNCHQIATIIYC